MIGPIGVDAFAAAADKAPPGPRMRPAILEHSNDWPKQDAIQSNRIAL